MTTHLCGGPTGDGPSRVLALLTMCCYGAAEDGPAGCSCWETIYDEVQVPVSPVDPVAIDPWPEMCDDCAYRPDSPERAGDERYDHGDKLDDLPHGDVPFWCHRGMRKVKEWRHPSGIVVPADGDYYEPPQRAGVPFQHDGTPARQCAGWAARRKHVETADEREARLLAADPATLDLTELADLAFGPEQ